VTAGLESVRLERRGPVGWLVLNRPERLNAFEDGMRQEFLAVAREALGDPETRVVVVTGAGRAFCAGADIGYLRDLFESGDTAALGKLVNAGGEIAALLRASSKPVIAAVNGAAAGGGANLALACDLRVASAEASIGQTFVKIGLLPDWGGTFFLPRLVGTARALELMWTGRMVKAEEALELGLFDRVVPAGDLETEVSRLAEELAAAAPEAVARIKAAVYAGAQGTLADALRREHDEQDHLFRGEDAAEGFRAFLEKRPPEFKGAARSRPATTEAGAPASRGARRDGS
jgi:2-(1,2-epoxy-1,2-dihydrophenyl)acetyl-CoA isomerase